MDSLFRHRLFDVETIVKQSILWGSTTAALLLVYAGLLSMGKWLSRRGWEYVADLTWGPAGLIFMLIMGRLFRMLQSYVDRRFYRQRWDERQLLASLAQRVRHMSDLQEVEHYVLQTIEQALSPASVTLCVFPTEGRERVVSTSDSIQGPLISASQAEAGTTGHEAVFLHEGNDPEALHSRYGIELMLALHARGRLCGLLLLGPRLRGTLYSAADVLLLQQVAVQVALALEVLLLVQEMKENIIQLKGVVQMYEEAERRANEDALTGLFNRRFLADAMDRASRSTPDDLSQLSIALTDIDNFKRINDIMGTQLVTTCCSRSQVCSVR